MTLNDSKKNLFDLVYFFAFYLNRSSRAAQHVLTWQLYGLLKNLI